MAMLDLTPTADEMAALIRSIPDELLSHPTPCPAYRLCDLIDHVGGLALAFAAVAAKDVGPKTAGAPGDAARLGEDWRARIPQNLAAMATAWQDPAAWTGMTQAGGLDLPGEVAGVVALDELVIHGWDIARASGQQFNPEAAAVAAIHGFLAQTGGPFGPAVDVDGTRPLLDRAIGLSGRDPDWEPARIWS